MSESGKPLVTRERVFRAADQLISEGINPTNKLVRDHLGGGSLGDICPYLKEWRALRKAAVPSAVPEVVLSVIGNCIDERANAYIMQFQQSLEAALQDAADWQAEANAANERSAKSQNCQEIAEAALLVAQGHIQRLEKSLEMAKSDWASESTELRKDIEASRGREQQLELRARAAELALGALRKSEQAAGPDEKRLILLDIA